MRKGNAKITSINHEMVENVPSPRLETGWYNKYEKATMTLGDPSQMSTQLDESMKLANEEIAIMKKMLDGHAKAIEELRSKECQDNLKERKDRKDRKDKRDRKAKKDRKDR